MKNVPEGYEVVSTPDVPKGYEVVGHMSFLGGVGEGLKDAGRATMYNLNKMGAAVNAGLANVNETIGLDSSLFRDNQKFYQENEAALKQPDRPFLQEAYNPLNYTVGGKGYKLASTLVGSAFGNEAANSAVTGNDFNYDDASTNAAIGLGIDPALKTLKLTGGSINDLFRRILVGSDATSKQDVAALQKLANKYDIELTPATASGSPSLARMEHNLADSAAGGLGLRQAVNAEKEGIDNAIYKGFGDMGANGSNTNAGEAFAQGTKEVMDNEKQYFNDAFSKLFARYGDDPIFSIKGVKAEANKLIDQAERNPIIKNTTAYRDAKALADTDSYLTWNDWSKLRTHLGSLTQDAMATGKASTGAYKQIYAQLENDLKSTVHNIGDGATLNQYKKLIDEYKTFKKDFDGQGSGARFINSIVRGKQAPEAIGHSINNSTLKAKGALAAGGFDRKTGIPSAKRVSSTDALLASRSPGGEGISMPKFIKATEKEGFKKVAEAPNLMLKIKTSDLPKIHLLDDVTPTRKGAEISGTAGKDAMVMEDLRKVANAIAGKNAHKNNSKTAIYNQINWMKANPLSAMFMFAKDSAMSAAYRSDMFKRWLSRGGISMKQYKQGMKDILSNPQASPKKIRATNILLNTEDNKKKNTQKLGL